MPKFVASINVYFDAKDQRAADEFAAGIGDAVRGWNLDPAYLTVTAITSSAARTAFDDMRS